MCVLVFLSSSASALDHLIATTQDSGVGKEIAIYTPTGSQIFSYTTIGGNTENVPTFLVNDPATHRFLVTCIGPTGGSGHSVQIFDYSNYPNGEITHLQELEVGKKPYHCYLSPDNLFYVANDESGTLAIIDPSSPNTFTEITAGLDHSTLVFAGDATTYDIFASRFGSPGGMDIVDGTTHLIRTTLESLLGNPHTGVYSAYTKRVYYGCSGGIEVFGTTADEKDTHITTIAMDSGQMIPLSHISPDGRYLIGGVHYDAATGSYFYSIDLSDHSITKCSSVSCKYYAYSPDGNWIVAGDYNKPADQEDYKVHVINCNPASTDYMKVVKEFSVTDSQIGFQAACFSADSRYAYLGLTTTDQMLEIDVDTLTETTINLPTNAAPKWLRVLPLTTETSHVTSWEIYQ